MDYCNSLEKLITAHVHVKKFFESIIKSTKIFFLTNKLS